MDNILRDESDDIKIGSMCDQDFSFQRALSFRDVQFFEPPQDLYSASVVDENGPAPVGSYKKRLSQMARDLQAIDGDLKTLNSGRMPVKKKSKEGSPAMVSLDPTKLARGRESAKESRARKKLYIDLMELKLSKLEEQKEMLNLELEQVRNNIKQTSSYGQGGATFMVGLHNTFKKLEQLFENKQEGDLDQINIILDSMRYRIGASGKERINAVNEFLKQILNICFPALQRYLMWSAANEKHLFRSDTDSKDEEEWYEQFYRTLELTPEQAKQIQAYQPVYKKHKEDLDAIMKELQHNKMAIFKHSEAIDDEIEIFRNVLGPLPCARFIFFIQRNRYRPELTVHDRNSASEFEEELKVGSKKRVKRS